MKILHMIGTVDGHDYAAVTFENIFKGSTGKELIDKVESGETLAGTEYDEEFEFNVRVVEVPEETISDELLDFIKKDVVDYDDSKHSNFYLETETI
jgi:hypothetical protein